MRSDAGGGYKQRDVERGFSVGMTRETIRSGVSTSGKERNHLFMNVGGTDFTELSGVSGLDSAADGRAFAWLDYDGDGMLDIAIVNANAPLLQMFRSQLPARDFMVFELVGGNATADAAPDWSPRDGYGARVTVHTTGGPIMRELHAGEGFAAQNSHRLHIGLGSERVESVAIRWPSGRETVIEPSAGVPLDSASVVTVFEDPARPPQSRRQTPVARPALPAAPAGRISAYVTTATWCGSCKASYPDLERLMAHFDRDALEVFAVPTGEPTPLLERYWERNHPPHTLLDAERDGPIVAAVLAEAGSALPWTVLTDETGTVLASFAGVPTISRIQELRGVSPE